MADNQNKPSTLKRQDIHTTLNDILDFGTDSIKLASSKTTPNDSNERLKKLVRQLQELNHVMLLFVVQLLIQLV